MSDGFTFPGDRIPWNEVELPINIDARNSEMLWEIANELDLSPQDTLLYLLQKSIKEMK